MLIFQSVADGRPPEYTENTGATSRFYRIAVDAATTSPERPAITSPEKPATSPNHESADSPTLIHPTTTSQEEPADQHEPLSKYMPKVLVGARQAGHLIPLTNRHQIIIFDDSAKQPEQVRNRILYFGSFLILTQNWVNAKSTTYFTSYRNDAEDSAQSEVSNFIRHLEAVRVEPSLNAALKMMKDFEATFPDEEKAAVLDIVANKKESKKIYPAKKQCLLERRARLMEIYDKVDEEREEDVDVAHASLLSEIRKLLVTYRAGWRTQDIAGESFPQLYNRAVDYSRKQSAELSALEPALEQAFRTVAAQLRSSQASTITIVTGTIPNKKQVREMQKMLKNLTKDMTPESKHQVAIQVIACDPVALQEHKKLDNYMTGDQDIYDTTEITDAFLFGGPSLDCFGKLFNSHTNEWDNRKCTVYNKERALAFRGGRPDLIFPGFREISLE